MPNWCSNSITISGATETIKTLWDDAQANWKNNDYGLLDAMVPMPTALKGTTSPAPDDGSQPAVDGYTNWYDWCVDNWGTKWDVSDEGLEYVDNGDGTSAITGYMDTAWAPPIEATYHEPGMDFLGEYIDGDDNFYEGLVDLIKGGAMQDDEVFARLVEDYAIEEDMEMWEEETA